MAYTRTWSLLVPAGSRLANQMDDAIRELKGDLQDRISDMFGIADFTADPIVPSVVKLNRVATGKILGGTTALSLRNAADSADNILITDAGAVTLRNTLSGTAGSFSGNVTAGSFSGPLTGNVTGNVSGSSGSTTGNAATATQLATPRTINGVAFDGTANITVPAAAGTLTGTALPATVVTSSLTTVGVIGTGTWQGNQIADAYLAGISGSKVSGTVANATNAGTASNATSLGGVAASGYAQLSGATFTGAVHAPAFYVG